MTMEGISRTIILETVDTASAYSAKLEQHLNLVIGAENQVICTAEESLSEIDAAFDDLTKSVLQALTERRDILKNTVRQIQEKGLIPLKACKEVIKKTLKNTQNYICEGQDLLEQFQKERLDADRCLKYLDQSSLLGNLPAVPNLEEVPAITFQLNVGSLRSGLVDNIRTAGTVSAMGPVQITSVTERPGALLVQWEEVEDGCESAVCYRLQQATGSHSTPEVRHSTAVYREVYRGAESSCVVRDVRPGTPCTLRVSCTYNNGDWSVWSLPKVVSTNLPHFQWSSDNPHYSTSVEGKIASKTDDTRSVLLSRDKQFGPNHSIEFTVLECPESKSAYEGIGISYGQPTDSLSQRGCLLLNAHGCIYLDGAEKTMRLPALSRGSKVTMSCEPLTTMRVRVHIDACDKTVTYDWRVDSTKLYFAALCANPQWKLMVE